MNPGSALFTKASLLGHWILDTGHWILDTGHWTQDTGLMTNNQ